MGVHSGKFATVNGITTSRNWTIADDQETKQYAASNTRGGHGSVRGIEFWNGSVGAYGAQPLKMPGELFAFLGYTAPDDDISGSGFRYGGDALVENVQVNWSWQDGAILSHQINFQGHLDLVGALGAGITDTSFPEAPPVTDAKIQYSLNGTDWLDWCDLLSAQLTLSCTLQAYANSCTIIEDADNVMRLWRGHKPGPLNWNLSVVEQNVNREENDLVKGSDYQLRLYVDATHFWLLKWGKLKGFTNITADAETGAILSQTVTFDMNGFVDDTVGSILLPDTTQWWPVGT